jgi:hypothetical protein
VRERAAVRLIGLLMMLPAPPAFAHGLQEFLQSFVFVAMTIGALGGLISGGAGLRPRYGVLSSLGALILFVIVVSVLAQLDLEAEGLALRAVPSLALMLTITAFAGAIPLAIAFVVAYALARILRERYRVEAKGDDTAP